MASALLLIPVVLGSVFFFKPGFEELARPLDTNNDRRLDMAELPLSLRRVLPELDVNGDEQVSPVEFRWYLLKQVLSKDKPIPAPPLAAPPHDFSVLRNYLRQSREQGDIQGMVLMLGHRDRVIFQWESGDLRSNSRVPIASASKWLTAAIIVGAADKGLVDLHQAIGEVRPDIPPAYQDGTWLELLSHTAGLPDKYVLRAEEGTLLTGAANNFLAMRPAGKPGEVFRYGGVSLMVAAQLLEQVLQKPWREIADEFLLEPLQMRDTVYAAGLVKPENSAHFVPQVSGGIHTTAEDYMKFLAMLARQDSSPELSAEAKEQMWMVRTVGIDNRKAPLPDEYATGAWCQQWRGDNCLLLHAQGALGTHPFIDRESGIYGVLMMVESAVRQQRIIMAIQDIALSAARIELNKANANP